MTNDEQRELCETAKPKCAITSGSYSDSWKPTVKVEKITKVEAAAAAEATSSGGTSDDGTNTGGTGTGGGTPENPPHEPQPGVKPKPNPPPSPPAGPPPFAPPPPPPPEMVDFQCLAPVFIQPCDWQTTACEQGTEDCPLGKMIYALPNAPMDETPERPCSAGYVGSNESQFQISASCGGQCPAGYYCPSEITLVPLPCTAAHYCEPGTVTPRPCPGGTRKNDSLAVMSRMEDCTDCNPGKFCPVGSHVETDCAPGTFNDQAKQDSCKQCEAGKYLDTAGGTQCIDCPQGSFCASGAAAALPCKAGTWSDTTGISAQSQCLNCPKGSSCSTGSTGHSPCAPGTFTDQLGESACTQCVAGTYQDSSGKTACLDCPAGSYCAKGASAALLCDAGSYRSAIRAQGQSDCTTCPAGFFCPTGSKAATACDAGTITASDGQSICSSCAAGKFQPVSGKTACDECGEGNYCLERATSQTACSPGQFLASGGKSACSDCIAGTYQSAGGKTACDTCPEGSYCGAGASTATQCAAGSYRGSTGGTAQGDGTAAGDCAVCPAGSACPSGATAPTLCAPGTITAANGQGKCTKCEAGKFQAEEGKTACESCTAGYYCTEGAAAALPCPGGTHMPSDSSIVMTSASLCVDCPAGTACSVGSAVATPCLPGSFSANAKQATCDLCDAGKFTATAGNTACEDCTPGYLCVEGSSAPQPCVGGTHANQTVLNLTGFLSSLDQCITCPAGTSCSVGSAEPKPCLPGSFAASPKTESCELCDAGKFTASAGNTACEDCTPGYLCVEGSSAPQPCRGGTHANQTVLNITGFLSSLDQCIVCPAGTSCSVGSAKPTPCLPGSFAASHEQATCDLCPPGQFQNVYGQTACKTCTRGFYCEQGAATPVPCPGGTTSNTSGVMTRTKCTPVKLGFWAPLGSALPEPCPASGFYCPGAADDTVNAAPGSKPIIVPVGDSTTTKEVETVKKEMTLDLSCADFDLQKVKQSLATQYNVDISLISLENPCVRRRRQRALQSSGLRLTITIATEGTASDGTPVTAAVGNLLAAVQAVDDTSLGGALGASLGVTVSVASTPPIQAQVTKNVKFVCPKGKWCTAGLIVDCTEGTYNPLTGQDLGTACLKCPEFSTSPKASTSINDCVCQAGFIQTILPDGSAKCECDAGKEIMNGVRCDPCQPGTYKPATGNSKCFECGGDVYSEALPLGATHFTTTMTSGAKSPTDCVCKAGYYLVANEKTRAETCRLCSSTWYQGREGTDCSSPGVTLETLPVRQGFFRQNIKAQIVRKCINIKAEVACLGSGNSSVAAVQQRITLDMTLEDFNEATVTASLARALGVPQELVEVSVAAGSLQVLVTVRATDGPATSISAAGVPSPPSLSVGAVQAKFDAVDSVALSTAFGATVVVKEAAQQANVSRASCSEGYGGPYCAGA